MLHTHIDAGQDLHRAVGLSRPVASTASSFIILSRRFVAATRTALAELMSRRTDDLDLVAFMADGVHSRDQNVRDRLPGKLRTVAGRPMRQACHAFSAVEPGA